MSVQGATIARKERRPRQWMIPAALALLLLLFVLLTIRTTRPPDERPYEFESPGIFGLLALRESLMEMGYVVKDLRGREFTLPDDGDLLLVWPGDELWSEAQVETLRDWVSHGRTAMIIADRNDPQRVLTVWGAEAFPNYETLPNYLQNDADIYQTQPVMPSAPNAFNVDTFAESVYEFSQNVAQVTVMGKTEWQATLGVEQIGDGWLWYNTDHHALTNDNLRDPDQVAILDAILRDVPSGGTIYFDGWHLYGPDLAAGEEGRGYRTLQEWLYRSPLGQATLFALVVGVSGWVLAGRRLGPPLKTERELRRREGAEYVRALAGLKRRAHARDEIAQRQGQRLKLALGKPRRIAASLNDAQFLAALGSSGEIDAVQLAEATALLERLRTAKTEEELVKSAAAIDAFLTK